MYHPLCTISATRIDVCWAHHGLGVWLDQELTFYRFSHGGLLPKGVLDRQVCPKVSGPNHTYLPDCVRRLGQVSVQVS